MIAFKSVVTQATPLPSNKAWSLNQTCYQHIQDFHLYSICKVSLISSSFVFFFTGVIHKNTQISFEQDSALTHSGHSATIQYTVKSLT